jgi:hypothetical protein
VVNIPSRHVRGILNHPTRVRPIPLIGGFSHGQQGAVPRSGGNLFGYGHGVRVAAVGIGAGVLVAYADAANPSDVWYWVGRGLIVGGVTVATIALAFLILLALEHREIHLRMPIQLHWPFQRVRLDPDPMPADPPVSSSPVLFIPSTVRVSINQLDISGLLAKSSANETVRIILDVTNLSGFSIQLKGLAGFIVIGGERQEIAPSLPQISPAFRLEIPFQVASPVEVRQVTPDLRQRFYEEGMWGKRTVFGFSLSNFALLCDVIYPDGSLTERQLTISDANSFVLHGPLREDSNFQTIVRQSLGFASSDWYDTDGPNEQWLATD